MDVKVEVARMIHNGIIMVDNRPSDPPSGAPRFMVRENDKQKIKNIGLDFVAAMDGGFLEIDDTALLRIFGADALKSFSSGREL